MNDAPDRPTAPTAEPLMSIGDLARATGIAVETIRMWERRYGSPAATRLPSGHRRYSQEQARRLRRVAEAVAHGARPSEVVGATDEHLDGLLAAARTPDPSIEREWLAAIRAFDHAAIRARVRDAAASRTPVVLAEEVLSPVLVAVGRAWADGRIDIRHEHFVSEVVGEELRAIRARETPRRDGPRVLFATLPGERHSLGLEMAAAVAAHAGAHCTLLGSDTPPAEIAAAARELDADAVAISVSLANGGVDADRVLADLRRTLPAWVRLFVGGAGTRRPRRAPRGIEYIEECARFDAALRAMTAGRRP